MTQRRRASERRGRWTGAVLVGPLPRELQKVTTYSGGLAARAAAAEAGRAFLAFLTRPELKPRLAAAGLHYKD